MWCKFSHVVQIWSRYCRGFPGKQNPRTPSCAVMLKSKLKWFKPKIDFVPMRDVNFCQNPVYGVLAESIQNDPGNHASHFKGLVES